MSNPLEQAGLSSEQSALLLDSTVQAIHTGFSGRYHADLVQSPEILAATLIEGEQKQRSLEVADTAITGESAFGFLITPVEHHGVIPAHRVSVLKVDPNTGQELFGSRSVIGVCEQINSEVFVTYSDFTAADVLFALSRFRQQETVDLAYASLI